MLDACGLLGKPREVHVREAVACADERESTNLVRVKARALDHLAVSASWRRQLERRMSRERRRPILFRLWSVGHSLYPPAIALPERSRLYAEVSNCAVCPEYARAAA